MQRPIVLSGIWNGKLGKLSEQLFWVPRFNFRVTRKIAFIESQNSLDGMHMHRRREASIMDSCYSIDNYQPSPFPMSLRHCLAVKRVRA